MKIVGIMQVGLDSPWIKYSIPNMKSLVDETILVFGTRSKKQRDAFDRSAIPLKDDESTIELEFHGKEWDGVNLAIRKASDLNPDWLFFMDSDEVIMTTREKFESLTKKKAMHLFKKIWLWQDEYHYRVDAPQKFQTFTSYTCLIPYHEKLKMERPHPFWLRIDWGRKVFQSPVIERHSDIIVKHYQALDQKNYKRKQLNTVIEILKRNPLQDDKELSERFLPHFEEPAIEPLPKEWL